MLGSGLVFAFALVFVTAPESGSPAYLGWSVECVGGIGGGTWATVDGFRVAGGPALVLGVDSTFRHGALLTGAFVDHARESYGTNATGAGALLGLAPQRSAPQYRLVLEMGVVHLERHGFRAEFIRVDSLIRPATAWLPRIGVRAGFALPLGNAPAPSVGAWVIGSLYGPETEADATATVCRDDVAMCTDEPVAHRLGGYRVILALAVGMQLWER